MYLRKASLDLRLIIIMENVGIPARYMAMAAPDLTECVPIFSGLKPRFSSLTLSAADWRLVQTVKEDIMDNLSSTNIVFRGVFLPVLG